MYICWHYCYYCYFVIRSNEHEISIFYRSSHICLLQHQHQHHHVQCSCSNIYIIHLGFPLSLSLLLSVCMREFMQNVAENRCCCCFVFYFFSGKVKFECMKNKISNHFLVALSLAVSRLCVRAGLLYEHILCEPIHCLWLHLLLYYNILFSLCSLPQTEFQFAIHIHIQHHHHHHHHTTTQGIRRHSFVFAYYILYLASWFRLFQPKKTYSGIYIYMVYKSSTLLIYTTVSH